MTRVQCPRCGGYGSRAVLDLENEYAIDVCVGCDGTGDRVCDGDESAVPARGGHMPQLLSPLADASAGSFPRSGDEHSLVSK